MKEIVTPVFVLKRTITPALVWPTVCWKISDLYFQNAWLFHQEGKLLL